MSGNEDKNCVMGRWKRRVLLSIKNPFGLKFMRDIEIYKCINLKALDEFRIEGR